MDNKTPLILHTNLGYNWHKY